jgi:hypothetical protein
VSLLLRQPPRSVAVDGAKQDASAFDFADGVLRVRFPNRAATVKIAISL